MSDDRHRAAANIAPWQAPTAFNMNAAENGFAGWLPVSGEMSERIRRHDWSATPLGPPEQWSPALLPALRVMLSSRFPQILWWGKNFIQFYNDAYVPIPGNKHPDLSFAQPGESCWQEIWHIIGPLILAPYSGGPSTWDEDIVLGVNRHGFVEETHFTIAYSPVPDDTAPNGISGVLGTVHEITAKVVGDRRLTLLHDLGSYANEAKTAEESCAKAVEILSRHGLDVPFALIYLLDADKRGARLAGRSKGMPRGAEICPDLIDFDGRDQVWPLASATERDEIIVVRNGAVQRLGALPLGPWPEPLREAVVAPIGSVGALVAGVSSRLHLDAQYRKFFALAANQVATAISAARAREEERKRAEALAQIDRAKTLFISNVSHEFRTPLTLLLGPLEERLARSAMPDDDLKLAHRNILRLLKLTNSLLDFSRVEAGRMQANYCPTDLGAATANFASAFRSACERAGLKLIARLKPLAEPVYVDLEMWETIILNLLSNAIKFTHAGEIEVGIEANGNFAKITVRDTGAGIQPSELPHVFERFHRIENTWARSHEGAGIGLALVKELVKLHGGTIAVSSVFGEGSAFTIELPFGKAHLPQDRTEVATTQKSTAPHAEFFVEEALGWLPAKPLPVDDGALAGTEPRNAGCPRVLVADDNADMRFYLASILGSRYDLELVGDGSAALEAINKRRPDLVLLDVMMPEIDGFSVLKTLRSQVPLSDLPVIVLSARAGEEVEMEVLAAGADDYVVKPFTARELLVRIKSRLEMTRVRNEGAAALRASEDAERQRRHELETALAAIPAGVLIAEDVACERITANSVGQRLLRLPSGGNGPGTEPDGTRSFDVFSPAGEKIAPDQFPMRRAAATGEKVEGAECSIRFLDGEVRHLLGNALPLFDASGNVRGSIGAFLDISERKGQELQIRRLLHEVNHRSKNLLTVIQAVARWTTAESHGEFLERFGKRIQALAINQDLLIKGEGRGIGLRDLVQAQLAHFEDLFGARIAIDGPELLVRPSAAQTIGMALHELATNACKYGALSNNRGRVEVFWRIRRRPPGSQGKKPAFFISWREFDGPGADMAFRKGFGSTVIVDLARQGLGAAVRMKLGDQGMSWRLLCPMSNVEG